MKGLLQLWLLRSRLASGQEFSRTRLILATVGTTVLYVCHVARLNSIGRCTLASPALGALWKSGTRWGWGTSWDERKLQVDPCA